MGTPRHNPIPAERILMIRPSALGDVCRTVPVLASLRSAWPDATIDWVVQDSFADAIAAHPAISNVIPFPRRRFAKAWRSPGTLLETLRWFRNLHRQDYDLVLDCQGLGRSGLMTAATMARRRIGHRDAREFAWAAYTSRVSRSDHPHTVDAMLGLVDACQIPVIRDMRLFSNSDDQSWVEEELSGADRIAVLAPTSRWSTKRWPAERWAHLIAPLAQRGWTDVVILGAPSEENQLGPLFDALRESESHPVTIHNYVGKTSIGQTMALIERSDLLIANDSAPLHMAIGFDTPCVGLFGPTDIRSVGPYQRPEVCVQKYDPVIDGPVHYRDAQLGDQLMRRITIEDVLERVDAVSAVSKAPKTTGHTKPREVESTHHTRPVGAPVRVSVEKNRERH